MTTARPFTYVDAESLVDGTPMQVWFLNPDSSTYDPAQIALSNRKRAVRPGRLGSMVEANVRTEFGNSYQLRLFTTEAAEQAATVAWQAQVEADKIDGTTEAAADAPYVDRLDLMVPADPDERPDAQEIETTPVVATSVNVIVFIDDFTDPDKALDQAQAALPDEFDGHQVRIRKAQGRLLPEEYVDIFDEDDNLVAEHVLAGEASYLTPKGGQQRPVATVQEDAVVTSSINIVAFIDDFSDPDEALARVQASLSETFDGHDVRFRKNLVRRCAEEYVDIFDEDDNLVAEHVLAGEASYLTPPRGRPVYNYPLV